MQNKYSNILLIFISSSQINMESRTITLTGNSSSLSSSFYPEIQLDERYNYSCCLLDFFTYNSIANVDETNNKLYYSAIGTDEFQVISVPVGSYEVDEIAVYINDQFKELNHNFKLNGCKNTMKCTIETDLHIDFCRHDSIGSLLGFINITLSGQSKYVSENVIKIQPINSIRIDCDLTTGSFHNGQSTHTLYEFCPTVKPGYKIILQPKNLIYLPITRRRINTLNISIVDELGKYIDFRGETITCRIHLKRDSS